MDVNVGYFSDPDDLQGLAHFLGQSICKFLFVLMYECTCFLYMNGWICVYMYVNLWCMYAVNGYLNFSVCMCVCMDAYESGYIWMYECVYIWIYEYACTWRYLYFIILQPIVKLLNNFKWGGFSFRNQSSIKSAYIYVYCYLHKLCNYQKSECVCMYLWYVYIFTCTRTLTHIVTTYTYRNTFMWNIYMHKCTWMCKYIDYFLQAHTHCIPLNHDKLNTYNVAWFTYSPT